MLKYYIEEGGDRSIDETREMLKRYEMFHKHFGDSLLCSTSLPKFAGKRFLVKQPSGRVCLRKLRPASLTASMSAKISARRTSIKTETDLLTPKMETDEVLDFYSNSSRQDFNLLADMGVPSDIFEPEHRAIHQQNAGPKSALSEAPEKLSGQVHRCFEVRQHQTVNRNQKIRFNFGAPSRPQNKLRRKWIGTPRVAPGFRSSGAIGKRLGFVQESKFESRHQFLFNTFYLDLLL